ncbi:hypothetical protein ACFXPX_07460 [Kitasatospora sp. NPDC059146]|uniref:hypothetical protein n=1 Tax=unclassified Kitasatospora TaxID=2633591 RepID=UPI0036C598F1
MDTEDMVRGALHDEASRLTVAHWSAEPVRIHARRQRRRMVVGASAVAAALAVAVGTGAVLSARDGGRALAPAAAPAAQAPLLPAGPAPEAVVAEPGQQLPLDRPGWWMSLKDREICIHDASVHGSGPGCGGYSWAASATTELTMQYYRNPAQNQEGLYNVVYHGPGQVARMTVELDGQAHWATVASLPGTPGYASGYAWASALKPTGSEKGQPQPLTGIRLAAYDAQGNLLASKTL